MIRATGLILALLLGLPLASAVPASLAFMHPGHLGALGTTGQRAWPGYEHVHLELQRGADPKDLHDPLSRMVGCFDASARYPADRLVLTYPVPC